MADMVERTRSLRELILPSIRITFALLCFAVLALWPKMWGVLGADHPLKVTLFMIVIVDWALITLVLVQQTPVDRRLIIAWNTLAFIACGFVIAFGVVELNAGRLHGSIIDPRSTTYNLYGSLLAIIGPTGFLYVVYSWPFWRRRVGVTTVSSGVPPPPPSGEQPPPKPDHGAYGLSSDDLYSWGKLASLIIMLLALFAFGLGRDEFNKLTVNWDELPAIMIVFIIAELGVILVVLSRQVADRVEKASAKTDSATDNLNLASAQLTGVQSKTKENFEKLEEALNKLDILTQTKLWETVARTSQLYDMQPAEFYNALDHFSKSWVPKQRVPSHTGAAALLGQLFRAFIGMRESSAPSEPDMKAKPTGTVRNSANAVCCVAADEVFVDASQRWLTSMRDRVQRNGHELIVWAVTTLLPTEFAFPAAYLEKPDMDMRAERTLSLERFVTSVVETCSDRGYPLGEYKRITVLDKGEHERLKGEGDAAKDVTLDNWLVWDSRMEVGGPGRKQVYDQSLEIVGKAGLHVKHHAEIGRGELTEFFRPSLDDEVEKYESTPTRLRLFPFTSTFKSRERKDVDVDVDVYSRRTGDHQFYILGSTAKTWETTVNTGRYSWSRASGAEPEVPQKLRIALEQLGWRSLRNWYIDGMHKAPRGTDSAAWWVSVKDKVADFFEPLTLDWGGREVVTHDLLMLGSRPIGADSDIQWHGAAISNLTSDRTECTIQLITGEDRLRDIKAMMDGLSAKFGSGRLSVEASDLVDECGSWHNWPTAIPREAVAPSVVRSGGQFA